MPDNIAANVIIHGCGKLLLQRKTPGYAIERYVGKLALIGGAWTSPEDRNPRDTVIRELREELRPPEVHRLAEQRLSFLGGFELRVPAADTGTRSFVTWNFVFAADVGDRIGEVRLAEGEAYVVANLDTLEVSLCWGHGHVLAQSASQLGWRFPHLFPNPNIGCDRLAAGEPASYSDLDLESVRLNPLRVGTISDHSVFD